MFNTIREFLEYVERFYGVGGIYDMGATFDQIVKAWDVYICRTPVEDIDFDSVDRERIRDILIEDFGLVFPEGNIKIAA
jgi:hypothetical protein